MMMSAPRQPSSSISHLAISGIRSVPTPVPDKAIPDATPGFAVEPGLHRRDRGRVAHCQAEAKAQAKRDIGLPHCLNRGRCSERSAGEQRACTGYPVGAHPIG